MWALKSVMLESGASQADGSIPKVGVVRKSDRSRDPSKLIRKESCNWRARRVKGEAFLSSKYGVIKGT